jgi:hypothetical protein
MDSFPKTRLSRVGLLMLAGALSLACKERAPTVKSRPSASASAAVPLPNPALQAAASAYRVRVPVGPAFAVYPGKGIGPIRIGATRSTIERHMEAPCEQASETLCRYAVRGVEFHLKDGVVERVHLHRQERPTGEKGADGKPATYGVFNGAIPPDLRFGMVPSAVQEHLKEPKRIEKVEQQTPFNTKELHHYEGMVLEYDQWSNGNLILGGVRIPG